MPFSFFKRREAPPDPVDALYAALVNKARDPKFYMEYAVPDTVDGRYDMVVIHAMLVMRRLRDTPAEVHTTGQRLFDLMFTDMDQSLREMGVGDMSVGKHVKKMAKAFYGRAAAYEAGLDGTAEELAQALTQNLFRHGEPPAGAVGGIASYLKRASEHLARQPVADIAAGKIDFSVAV
ncbi:MAG: ubiquinol-cytochrome C chaperone family protein [Rhodospirillaceae bacterium]